MEDTLGDVSHWRQLVPWLVVASLGAITALVMPLTAGAFWPIVAAPPVWQHHAVTFMTDPVSSLPVRGGEWVVQPWVPALLFRGAWLVGGVGALSALSALVAACTALLLLASACRVAGPVPALLAVLLALPLLQPQLLATQQVAVLLAALLWWAVRGGSWWWSAPLIVIVWANAHGSVPVALVLCAAAGLGMVEEASPVRRASTARRAAWMVACSASVLATPLGSGIVEYVRGVLSIQGLPGLTPAWRHLEMTSWRAVWLALVMVSIVGGVLRAGRSAGRLWQLVPAAMMLVLAIGAVRNMPFVAVVLAPQLGVAVSRAWMRWGWAMQLRSSLVAGVMVAVSCIGLVVLAPGAPLQRSLAMAGMPPASLLDGIRPGDRVFASIEWADYVRVRTGARVHVDARLERYRAGDLAAYRSAVVGGHTGCPGGANALVCIGGQQYRKVLLRRATGDALYGAILRDHACTEQYDDDSAAFLALAPGGGCIAKLA